jgi:predicted nucleic acid-binding Zn ribbon protein
MKALRKPEKIGSIIDAILAERGYLSICREYDVVRQWPRIVGERVAAATQCTSAEAGVLFVRVASAAWRHEISYLKQEILSHIREKTSCTTIREIMLY